MLAKIIDLKKLRSSGVAYLLILPAFFIYFLIILIPSINTIYLSLNKWDGMNPVKKFVGFANYIKAFQDPQMYNAFVNNIVWVALLITVPLTLALLLAVTATKRGVWGRDQLQAIYFIPHVISPVAVALIWTWIYNPKIGLLSNMLMSLGLSGKPYGILGDPNLALYGIIFTNIWGIFGFCTVIYVNALQAIDQSLYDAAMIDGASSFQRFVHVTLPGISSVTQGGPVGRTEVVGYVMYVHAFKLNRVGYGSAIAVILTMVVLVLGIFYISNREKRITA
jgi:ABC-type sugar transport system permease subunit